jgi:signal transduction histidine kinase
VIPIPAELRAVRETFIVEETRSSLRHALRNKLGAIRNCAFFLSRKVGATPLAKEEPRVAQFFALIETQIDEMNKIVDVTPSTEATGGVADVDANQVVRQLIGRLGILERSRIRGPEDGRNPVRANALELELLIFCLVENALEAIPTEGAVRVDIGRGDDKVWIDVVDDGPGLEGDARERALEPFFTTRPGHAGCGLNVARRLAGRADGTIELLAAAPRGLRARVALPLPGSGAVP